MVYWRVDKGQATTVHARLAEHGILVDVVEADLLRAVTHLDIDDAGIDRTLSALRKVLADG